MARFGLRGIFAGCRGTAAAAGMTVGSPRLSVVIPVFNRAHLVQRAIDSVLAQDFTDFDLLVIDDGSTDASAEVVERNSDPRLRLIRNPENLGIPRTRQRGLDEARGAYIALLDSDDRMRPNRLAQQVAFMDAHPEIATLGGSVQKYYPDGRRAGRRVRPSDPDVLRVWMLFRTPHANTTLMGRTDILRRYGYDPDFPVSEDFDLAARLARHHRAANLPQVLTDMLEHDGRTSGQSAERNAVTKSAIMRYQLAALGVAFDEDDLERHYRLSRVRPEHLARWPDYADWAADWMARLVEANAQARIYDPKAMRALLGFVWGQCWLTVMLNQGWRAGAKGLWLRRPERLSLPLAFQQIRARFGAS